MLCGGVIFLRGENRSNPCTLGASSTCTCFFCLDFWSINIVATHIFFFKFCYVFFWTPFLFVLDTFPSESYCNTTFFWGLSHSVFFFRLQDYRTHVELWSKPSFSGVFLRNQGIANICPYNSAGFRLEYFLGKNGEKACVFCAMLLVLRRASVQ